jgi:hypothetical protein
MDWLEEFWEDILSETPLRIVSAWVRLTEDEQATVRVHLMAMATEDGWAEVQRAAAQAALEAISNSEKPPDEHAAKSKD